MVILRKVIAVVYEIEDTSKVKHLFEGWQETLIYSCLEKVMGKIYVTDLENPESAFAYVGCFGFPAGAPDRELILNKPEGFSILVPQNEAWAKVIEECFPSAKRFTRYAIKKNTVFDREALKRNLSLLPKGYVLQPIDAKIYDLCFEKAETRDFVSVFESKDRYLELGRGMVILKDGQIVAGASSYTRYREGIEIEVDTVEPERRKHLATVVCSALILRCLEEGLYPSWDAQNMNSVHLAEKLGYELDYEYAAYEILSEKRTPQDFSDFSLETADLILKKPIFEDWKEIYHNLWRHAESARHMLWQAAESEQAARERMERTIEYQKYNKYAFLIFEKKTNRAIGFAGMKEVEPGVYEDTGVALGPEYIGKGYGTQVLNALVEEARRAGAHRFIASCRKANLASHNLQLTCGFVFTHEEERVDPRDGQPYVLEFSEKQL